MVKNRLIFTLLMQDDIFMLSRNFRLQSVGNLSWLKEFYDINSLLYCIDELIVLDVDRKERNLTSFCKNLSDLVKDCFMPVAAGGGIRTDDDAYNILKSGADKIIINSLLFENPEMVKRIASRFGSQCVVASLDYKIIENERIVFTHNGTLNTNIPLTIAAKRIIDLGIGELYLTSIDRDGTGQGYDTTGIKEITDFSNVPVIASGGVGRFDQFFDGILIAKADAVSTANLFYFMDDALSEARIELKRKGVDMAVW